MDNKPAVYKCPSCGKKPAKGVTIFAEAGEWGSSKYAFECEITLAFYCRKCNLSFWVYKGDVEAEMDK